MPKISENVSGAENQQETKLRRRVGGVGSSETTRETPLTKEEIVAYLNGAAHDASLNKRKRIRFAQKHKEWLEVIRVLLYRLGSRGWIYKEGKSREVYVLETLNREISFSFNPLRASTAEKVAYLRGFFDAEGGVPHNSGPFYIQLVQKNRMKILMIKRTLQEMGISTGKVHNPSARVDPYYWRIFVSKKSHLLFAETIGSWHPIKQRIFRERMKI
ncbi:MAG: LAGLIDADG family homing endonuclease [Patescibacteria group bacterium]